MLDSDEKARLIEKGRQMAFSDVKNWFNSFVNAGKLFEGRDVSLLVIKMADGQKDPVLKKR